MATSQEADVYAMNSGLRQTGSPLRGACVCRREWSSHSARALESNGIPTQLSRSTRNRSELAVSRHNDSDWKITPAAWKNTPMPLPSSLPGASWKQREERGRGPDSSSRDFAATPVCKIRVGDAGSPIPGTLWMLWEVCRARRTYLGPG